MRYRRQAAILGAALVVLLGPAGGRAKEASGPRLRGKLQMRYELRQEEGTWEDRFRLRRACIDAGWKALKWLELRLELEAAEMLDFGGERDWGVRLEDAWGRMKFFPALRLQFGYFKKPFSRLKMASSWDLLLPARGCSTAWP